MSIDHYKSVWIGFDPREAAAFSVARHSLKQRTTQPLPVYGLVLDRMRAEGLYSRPTSVRGTRLYDDISEHPMATEFALTRFLVPELHRGIFGGGWSLFLDADMLVLGNIVDLFRQADDRFAVMCVKHKQAPSIGDKMDGQVQSDYPRKNWSSVMLFNTDHPANQRLTLELVNTAKGIDLHRFCWLQDDEIGELGVEWNFLVGHSVSATRPRIVHFTEGGPWLPKYDNVPFADVWRKELADWAC